VDRPGARTNRRGGKAPREQRRKERHQSARKRGVFQPRRQRCKPDDGPVPQRLRRHRAGAEHVAGREQAAGAGTPSAKVSWRGCDQAARNAGNGPPLPGSRPKRLTLPGRPPGQPRKDGAGCSGENSTAHSECETQCSGIARGGERNRGARQSVCQGAANACAEGENRAAKAGKRKGRRPQQSGSGRAHQEGGGKGKTRSRVRRCA